LEEQAKVVPMLLGPGQGKSYVCFLLAMRYSVDRKKVAIVVHNGTALTQYQEILANYKHEGISVVEVDKLAYDAPYEVFICDESDELWKNHSAVF